MSHTYSIVQKGIAVDELDLPTAWALAENAAEDWLIVRDDGATLRLERRSETVIPVIHVRLSADEIGIVKAAVTRNPMASACAMRAHIVGMLRSDPTLLSTIASAILGQIKPGDR